MSNSKYLADGQLVNVVRRIDDEGSIIERVFETEAYLGDYYSESYAVVEVTSEPTYINNKELYDNPPTEKLHDKVKILKAEIADLHEKYAVTKRENNKLIHENREHEQRLEYLKGTHSALENIDDYLNNRVTHVVVFERYTNGIPRIVSIEDHESRTGSESREKKLRLITLAGEIPYNKKASDFTWQFHKYSDTSGGYVECYPCTSMEQAVTIAKAKLLAVLSSNENKTMYIGKKYKACLEFGVSVPEWLENLYTKHQSEAKAKKRKSLEIRRSKLTEELRELESQEATA